MCVRVCGGVRIGGDQWDVLDILKDLLGPGVPHDMVLADVPFAQRMREAHIPGRQAVVSLAGTWLFSFVFFVC